MIKHIFWWLQKHLVWSKNSFFDKKKPASAKRDLNAASRNEPMHFNTFAFDVLSSLFILFYFLAAHLFGGIANTGEKSILSFCT